MKLFSKGPVFSYETCTDEELMELVQSNDALAFNELYARFKAPLYNYFFGLTSSTLADELLQETFLKIINKKESYRFEAPVKNWIWMIAKNSARDYWRSTDHKYRSMIGTLYDEEGEEVLAHTSDSMEEITHLKMTREELMSFIDKLPREQKEILYLYIQSELSNQEIADLLNIGLGAVKSVIFRSREKIISHFTKRGQ